MQVAVEKGSRRICKRWATPITVTEFEKWETQQSGDYHYELCFKKRTTASQRAQLKTVLATFLSDFLETAGIESKGTLVINSKFYINTKLKHTADIVYFKQSSVASGAGGKVEVPAFIIEIISQKDTFFGVEAKLADYFAAGVQLVWYFSPTSGQMYVQTSEKAITIYAAGNTVTAFPVLPNFKVEIDKLFTPA